MCCLAGANDNDNKHASSPEVRNFLTWRASQQSCKASPSLLIPPTFFTPPLARPILKVSAYFHIIHSFAHPSILKMWILAHHHCLITRALYPVYMYFPPNFPFTFPTLGVAVRQSTFHFGSETGFHFRFLENRLINWGRNHYKRYSHSQPLIPVRLLKSRGRHTIGPSTGRAEEFDSFWYSHLEIDGMRCLCLMFLIWTIWILSKSVGRILLLPIFPD